MGYQDYPHLIGTLFFRKSLNIEVFKDRLRLARSWQGKRFWLYIGLPDTKPNRKAASIKARQIELDMASGNFDPSLVKYKPQKQESISVSELGSHKYVVLGDITRLYIHYSDE